MPRLALRSAASSADERRIIRVPRGESAEFFHSASFSSAFHAKHTHWPVYTQCECERSLCVYTAYAARCRMHQLAVRAARFARCSRVNLHTIATLHASIYSTLHILQSTVYNLQSSHCWSRVNRPDPADCSTRLH